ncbi:hypothetical protein JCM14635_25720 [Megalodesulfovibrio paquesii]
MLYQAEEAAGAFLGNITAPYLRELRCRAEWVSGTFNPLDADELSNLVNQLFSTWTIEFQQVDLGFQGDLF